MRQRRINIVYLTFCLVFSCAAVVYSQGIADVSLGFGTAKDSSNGLGIENVSSANAFGSCAPSATAVYCEGNPGLNGLFMGFQGDGMLQKHFGIAGEWTFQPERPGYGPLTYRQTFYDVGGVFAPISNKHAILQLEGGIGGAKTGFSFNETECVGVAVCQTEAQSVGSSSHFQQHLGAGVEIFLTSHIFIKPELDFHHVDGFTQQFGRDNVLQPMVWIGYNFGQP